MKYINAGTRIVSLIIGIAVFGIATPLLFFANVQAPWAGGMIAGALAAITAACIIAWISYREHMKFMTAHDRVRGQVLEFSLATVCNIGRSRRAYVFLTVDHLRLFLWDKRPYLESTVSREEAIISYPASHPNHLTITFDDLETIELLFPDAAELVAAMRANGYRVEEVNDRV